ncbi:MAG: hypothetical protein ACOC8Y_00005 [Candidatus Natronoplasma sp.]
MEKKKEIYEKNDEGRNILMIACYESPYSEKSLKMIKTTIEKEKPSKIIILKMIERPHIENVIDTRIGKKAEEDFLKTLMEEKKKEVDAYAEDVLKVTKKSGIPTEVRLRKADRIADKIIEQSEEMKIDHIIIQDSDRDILEKLVKGNIEKRVKEKFEDEDVTELEGSL